MDARCLLFLLLIIWCGAADVHVKKHTPIEFIKKPQMTQHEENIDLCKEGCYEAYCGTFPCGEEVHKWCKNQCNVRQPPAYEFWDCHYWCARIKPKDPNRFNGCFQGCINTTYGDDYADYDEAVVEDYKNNEEIM